MAVVSWRLSEFLQEKGLSVYRLHAELSGQISRTGLYKITRGETSGVDFASLASILSALERLTGKPVALQGVLHYEK